LNSHSVEACFLLTTLILSHAVVYPRLVPLADSLLMGKDPPEKFFGVKLVIGVLISLLEHAEDFIHNEEVVAVSVKKVEQTVVANYLGWLLVGDDLGLEGAVEAGLPAHERHLLETLFVVPFASISEGGAVLVTLVVGLVSLLLVPVEVVGAGVVHPLELGFLPDVVHADPVILVVADQSSDKLVLEIVVDGDKVTSPLHANELSRPPVSGSSLNSDDVLILFTLILKLFESNGLLAGSLGFG
jgi:hypothetical protein